MIEICKAILHRPQDATIGRGYGDGNIVILGYAHFRAIAVAPNMDLRLQAGGMHLAQVQLASRATKVQALRTVQP